MAVMAGTSWVLQLVSSQPEFLLWGYLSLSLFVISVYTNLFFNSLEARILVWVLSLMCSLLMEVNLLVLLILPIYQVLFDRVQNGASVPLWFYGLIALIPLVRIDATIMLAVPICYLLITDRRIGFGGGIAMLFGLAVQLVVMKLVFGHMFSVSSTLKAADMEGSRLISNLLHRGADYTLRNLLAFGLLVLAFGLAVIRRHWLAVAIVISVAGALVLLTGLSARLLFSVETLACQRVLVPDFPTWGADFGADTWHGVWAWLSINAHTCTH
jgi:hypothetical protein